MDLADPFARLKKMASHDNRYQRTVGDFLRDAEADLRATLADRGAWTAYAHDPDRPVRRQRAHLHLPAQRHHRAGQLDRPVAPGETVRLRLINGSAMTYFDVRIPGCR